MKHILGALLFCALFWVSCNGKSEEDLYGKWNYLEVSNPEQSPVHKSDPAEIAAKSPSIVFEKGGRLVMNWDGKVLSHGSFKLEYPNIAYIEQLPKGKTRNIRFLIKKMEADTLVFQTQEADPVRVIAVKAK